MEMFSDLRQFDEAKKWAEEYSRTKGDNVQVQELINKQAEWSEEVKNYEAAAEMYIKVRWQGWGPGGGLSVQVRGYIGETGGGRTGGRGQSNTTDVHQGTGLLWQGWGLLGG